MHPSGTHNVEKPGLFTAEIWIAWLGATLLAALTGAAFAFTTFETKDDSKDKRDQLLQRLSTIEGKIDKLFEQKSR